MKRAALSDRPQGIDDSTFDYWPGTFGFLSSFMTWLRL